MTENGRLESCELQLLSPQDETLSAEAESKIENNTLTGPEVEIANGSPGIDVDNWPQCPRKLRINAHIDKLSTALEVALACVPTAFLVLAILAISVDGNQLSNYGEGIVQATKLGPSIFPIVFAAIVGNLMRSYALWRVENCAPLGLLEQLNGSTSFAGTVISALALRRFGIITVAILLLWVMSPLGGQSALRMLSQTSSTISGNTSVAYMSMNTTSGFSGTALTGETQAATDSLYTTSLLATQGTRNSPRDLWSWPRIPLLRALPLNQSNASSNPWRECAHDNQTVYSSLVGLLVRGIPSDKDAQFPVESSYFDLDCRALAYNIFEFDILDRIGGNLLRHNATDLLRSTANFPNAPALAWSNFFVDTSYNFTAPSPTQSHVNLFYGTRDTTTSTNLRASVFNCTVSTIRVESWVACHNGSCAVTRMRRSEKDTRPSSVTPFEDPDDERNNWTTLNNLLSPFPFAAGTLDMFQSSPTDSYIYGDPSLLSFDFNHSWAGVSEEEISTRFTSAFNTYWQASLAPFTRASASPSEQKNSTKNSVSLEPPFNDTLATTTQHIIVYRANWAWVAVFITATVLLQLCALAGLLLNWITVAPDILGFVSSLTRENPYIPLPRGGSSLSGLERARLLRDLPVQILDIDSESRAGHITLASGGMRTISAQKLNQKRQYF